MAILFFVIIPVLNSCNPILDVPTPDAGQLDLSNYVALGNSFTAGYTNGALYRTAQKNAYPALISRQFQLLGGGEFRQPLLPDDIGFGIQNGKMVSRYHLSEVFLCDNTSMLFPKRMESTPSPENLENIAGLGPYQNFGVPSLLIEDIYDPQTKDPVKGNPYYARFASDSAITMFNDIMSESPTFTTLWLGFDDILQYAINGGTVYQITGGDKFSGLLDNTLSGFKVNGSKGAIATIPGFLISPYFTFIPYNGLFLDSSMVAFLNQYYNNEELHFHVGYNAYVIEDSLAAGGIRQIGKGEYLLFSIPQDSLRCGHWGAQVPIPSQYVLDSNEVYRINSSIKSYNQIIEALADKYDFALVDMYRFYQKINLGFMYNGITFNSRFIDGNFFSLDALHPNDRGYALIANEFLNSINKKYNTIIPLVDVTAFRGIRYP